MTRPPSQPPPRRPRPPRAPGGAAASVGRRPILLRPPQPPPADPAAPDLGAGTAAPATPRRPRLEERLGGLRHRFDRLSVNRLLPNLLTMVGLCAGLTAIRFAVEERWDVAAALVVVAAFIDGLDGRLARLLKATSRFGAEFDSLSDFLCFGVAPALILYLWALPGTRGLGFVPCLLFAVCMALRLARFNAALDPAPPPPLVAGTAAAPAAPAPSPSSFFTGVPAPAGAGLALFPLFAALAFEGWDMPGVAAAFRHPAFVVLVLVGVAALLVSTLPTWSLKRLKVPRGAVLPLLLGAAGFVALLVAEPWAALAAAGLIYLGLVPHASLAARARRGAAAVAPAAVATAAVAPAAVPPAEDGRRAEGDAAAGSA